MEVEHAKCLRGILSGSSESHISTPTTGTPPTVMAGGLPVSSAPVQYVPMMPGQQLPPIRKFRGEEPDGEGESFENRIEQFEAIANMY